MSAPLHIIRETLGSEAQAKSVLEALAAAGWVVVPRVPTEDMLEAAFWSAHAEDAEGVWSQMIGALPLE